MFFIARSAAAPYPTIPGTFSVPARRLRSCAPPCTKDLIFKKNHVECTSSDDFRQKPLFILNGCKGVVIRENKLEEVCDKKMEFRQMKKKYIKVDF